MSHTFVPHKHGNNAAKKQKDIARMEAREKIYKGLKSHYGSLVELQRRANVKERWVTMVLKGEAEDEDLLLIASKLWHELEADKKRKLEEAEHYADMAAAISMTP